MIRALLCCLVVGLAHGLLAGQITYQTKADWDSGSMSGVEDGTFGMPALTGSPGLSVLTNYGLLADNFADTTASRANYLTATAGSIMQGVTGYAGLGPVTGPGIMLEPAGSAGSSLFYYPATLSTFDFSGYFLDDTFTSGLFDFGILSLPSSSVQLRSNGGNASNLTYVNGGTEYNPSVPGLFPRKSGRWRHFQVLQTAASGAGANYQLLVDGNLMFRATATGKGTNPYFYSSVPLSQPLPGLDFVTLSTWTGPNQIYLSTPLAGYEYVLFRPLAGVTETAVAQAGVTVTPSEWDEDEPYLGAELIHPTGAVLGYLTSTVSTAAFQGNFLSLQMSYTPTGTWEKSVTFSQPLPGPATVNWTTPSGLEPGVAVTVFAEPSTTGTFNGLTEVVSGSGAAIAGSTGAVAIRLIVELSTSDETQSPRLSSLTLTWPDPVATPSPTATPQAQPNFPAWNVPNPFHPAQGPTRIHLEGSGGLLRIFAATREVRTLQGTAASGQTDYSWDGDDNSGLACPSGVYFGVFDGTGVRIKIALLRP